MMIPTCGMGGQSVALVLLLACGGRVAASRDVDASLLHRPVEQAYQYFTVSIGGLGLQSTGFQLGCNKGGDLHGGNLLKGIGLNG